jgi:hypothetical protein
LSPPEPREVDSEVTRVEKVSESRRGAGSGKGTTLKTASRKQAKIYRDAVRADSEKDASHALARLAHFELRRIQRSPESYFGEDCIRGGPQERWAKLREETKVSRPTWDQLPEWPATVDDLEALVLRLNEKKDKLG